MSYKYRQSKMNPERFIVWKDGYAVGQVQKTETWTPRGNCVRWNALGTGYSIKKAGCLTRKEAADFLTHESN